MEVREICNSHTCVVGPNEVDISGLDKKVVLNALYKKANPLGNGWLAYKPNHSLSDEEAQTILLKRRGDIEYLHGRVMKINLSGNSVNTYLYNRDNGEKAAEAIIQELHDTKKS